MDNPFAHDDLLQLGKRPGPPLFMTDSVVNQIEAALCRVDAFGEVRLIVVKGRLRFIEVTRSESVKGD